MELKHQQANTIFKTLKCFKSIKPILILRAVLIMEGQLKMLKVSFGTNRWSVNSILSHSTRNTWIRNSKMKMISSKSFKTSRINKEGARRVKRKQKLLFPVQRILSFQKRKVTGLLSQFGKKLQKRNHCNHCNHHGKLHNLIQTKNWTMACSIMHKRNAFLSLKKMIRQTC